MKSLPYFILILVLLNGCTSAVNHANWPDTIPSHRYFLNYYAQDSKQNHLLSEEEYLLWIQRFYFGWELYQRGWLQASQELVDTLKTPEDKSEAQEKMRTLGQLIAPEWARHKRVSLISTGNLSIWGNALNESVVRQEQLKMIDTIKQDVSALLAKTLIKETITESRYYRPTEFSGGW
jgi:hypothetical protein